MSIKGLAWRLTVVVGAVIGIAACSEEKAPVEVRRFDPQNGLTVFSIIAVDEGVRLKSLQVNRGNCKDVTSSYYSGTPPFPAEIKFGDKLGFVYACDVLEVVAGTNRGDWTFTWK